MAMTGSYWEVLTFKGRPLHRNLSAWGVIAPFSRHPLWCRAFLLEKPIDQLIK